VGRAIGSRYELDDEIGRGAFGAVWRGRVRSSGELVAIKVLLEEFAADADVVTRFLRERTALVGLNHRSLVRLRDLVVEGDILALVMQLVEGPDLKKYLAGRSRLDPVEAGLLVAEVAEGLAAAHSAGIVHRDIKPANVLLEQVDGGLRPLLTDFGIARIADAPSVTRTHQVVGTPYYLAPEVVAGKKATPAADIYASGVMLYELITGHPVFRGPDAVSVFRQHMNTIPERPAEIPVRLWPVIAACLAKEPEARPSALVLAAQLRAAVGRTVTGADGEVTHHLPIEGAYGTLRLPPISGGGNPVAPVSTPGGDVSMPPPPPRKPAVVPLAPQPVRPADGKVAGWDAPPEPDAIGAGAARRPAAPAGAPTVPVAAPYPQNRQAPPPPPMPQQQSQQGHQRLAAYPEQPRFGPSQGQQAQQGQQGQQQYQQGGYQQQQGGYQQQQQQQQPNPQYQNPTQFQGSTPAPPRPVAYTPNQQPVLPRQEPRQEPKQQPQTVINKKVVRRRMPLGCLIKLAILAAVGYGIYAGVNWVTFQINHFDLNNWVSTQWHHIWNNVSSKVKNGKNGGSGGTGTGNTP
jgi:serine/threonine protein kinase, bacterial